MFTSNLANLTISIIKFYNQVFQVISTSQQGQSRIYDSLQRCLLQSSLQVSCGIAQEKPF